jgi:predicted glycoside hydrolase/deacetylase ChbG (UPF0249 family)
VTPGEKKLVIVADDFGLTKGVNKGVIECHRAGIVTSASLIVNTPGSHQACAIACESNFDVGIHVNLTLGRPISPPGTVASLVSSDQTFHGLGGFLRRALQNRLKWSEIESEARAQIEHALSIGLMPKHLDSHHHVHVFPTIFKIFSRLCHEYEIPFLRIPTEALSVNLFHFHASLKKILISLAVSRANHARTQRGVDCFYGLSSYNSRNPRAALKNILHHVREGTSELMVHPAYNDPSLETIDPWNRQREKEVEILTSNEIKEAIRTHEIKLVSFGDLLSERH